MRELVAEAKGCSPGRDVMLESLLKQLLVHVFRAQAERGSRRRSRPPCTKRCRRSPNTSAPITGRSCI